MERRREERRGREAWQAVAEAVKHLRRGIWVEPAGQGLDGLAVEGEGRVFSVEADDGEAEVGEGIGVGVGGGHDGGATPCRRWLEERLDEGSGERV